MRPEYCTSGAFSSRSPGGVKRGPMLRPLAVAIALAALAACERPGPARLPAPVMPPGTARIAVVPFRTAGAPGAQAGGGGEGVPADAGPAAARMLAAPVAYEAAVVHAPDGALLAVDRFEYAQQALTENLLQLPRFVESGGRWLTREELLDQALARTAERLARALGAPPVRR